MTNTVDQRLEELTAQVAGLTRKLAEQTATWETLVELGRVLERQDQAAQAARPRPRSHGERGHLRMVRDGTS